MYDGEIEACSIADHLDLENEPVVDLSKAVGEGRESVEIDLSVPGDLAKSLCCGIRALRCRRCRTEMHLFGDYRWSCEVCSSIRAANSLLVSDTVSLLILKAKESARLKMH